MPAHGSQLFRVVGRVLSCPNRNCVLISWPMRTHASPRLAPRHLLALALPLLVACWPKGDEKPIVGLITKTESNPFVVKMKEGAEQG